MAAAAKLASVCVIGALIAAAVAQPGTDKHPIKAPDAPKAPEGQPDMAAMMAAWEAAAKPGKMHEHLAKGAGTWEGTVKMWMDPAAPPSESKCTTVMTPVMGGRFVRGETKGNFDMGQGPVPFEGFGIYGYNNTTKQFESTWCDNLGTCMMHFTGALSEDGKVLTWNSKFVDPMTGKDTWMREVETYTGPDSMKLEMYGPSMDGKGEMKMMEITYTRVAKAATPKADLSK